jgi:hypothetical protein
MPSHRPLTRAAIAATVVATVTAGLAVVLTHPTGTSVTVGTRQIATPQSSPADEPLPRVVTLPAPTAKPPAAHPAAKPRPATKPRAAHPATSKPTARTSHTPKSTPVMKKKHTTSKPVPGPTSWSALNAAIARIHSSRMAGVHWVIKDTGWWATADWYTNTVYVSPKTTESKLYDVVAHEWSHLLSVYAYAGNVDAAVAAMKAYFGGSGLTGAERAADCMAKLQGAKFTAYTPCTSTKWRAGAALLLAGRRLPQV